MYLLDDKEDGGLKRLILAYMKCLMCIYLYTVIQILLSIYLHQKLHIF